MKRYIRAAAKQMTDAQIQKNFDFNQHQTQVGSKLKTYSGSVIQRSPKYGVGKEIGGDIYVHKFYAEDVVPEEILKACNRALDYTQSGFLFNCIRYSPKTQSISYQESPDFNTAREPIVGDYITVFYDPRLDPEDFVLKKGHSNYIWHHKWIWVRNDYPNFDVNQSWLWSRKWLSTLKETSDGNGISRWNAQLDKYDLPHDSGYNGKM